MAEEIIRSLFETKGGRRMGHSVGPLLERGIREKVEEEIESIVVEVTYRRHPKVRERAEMEAMRIGDEVSRAAKDEEQAMHMLEDMLIRRRPEIMSRIEGGF